MFKTQYTNNTFIGRYKSSRPCENFEPGQGKRVAEVIQDFVHGIDTGTPNLNGYQTPELATESIPMRGNRSLAIDSAFSSFENENAIGELERQLTPEEIAVQRQDFLENAQS